MENKETKTPKTKGDSTKKKELLLVIESYKERSPEKYKAKKEELEARLAEL